MSRYYANYGQYLGAQRCCDFRGQGPIGPTGPQGESAIGQRGYTGPTGESIAGPTGESITGPTGPAGQSVSMIGGFAGSITNQGNTGCYFGAYIGGTSLDLNQNESNVITRIPFDCEMSNLYVDLITNSPGSGTSYTYTVRNNSMNTPLSVTISDLNVSGNNTTNTATFNSGDLFTVMSTPTNGPTGTNVRWSCKLTSV